MTTKPAHKAAGFIPAVALLPSAPGVYQFLNAAGKTLYVGKARNLKNVFPAIFKKPFIRRVFA